MATNTLQYNLELKVDKIDGVLAGVQKTIDNLKPNLNLNLNSEIAKGKIEAIKNQILGLENSKVELKVKSDLLEAKIKKAQSDLSALQKLETSPVIDLKIATAEAKIKQFESQLRGIKNQEVAVDIKTANLNTNIRAIQSGFANAGSTAGDNFAKNFENRISNLQSIINSTIGNVLANGIGKLSSVVGGGIDGAINNAKGLESTRAALNGIIGNTEQTKKLLKEVVKFANTTPFTIPQLAETTKQLAAVGFGSDEITGNLKKLGNIAAGTGTPLSQIAYAFGQIKTAGRAYTQDLNQLQNAGIPIYKELAKSIGTSIPEIKKLVETGQVGFEDVDKVLTKLTTGTGIFAKGIDNASNTVEGRLTTLTDSFDGLVRSVFGITDEGDIIPQGLFDRASQGIKGLIDTFSSPEFIKSAQDLGLKIGEILTKIVEFDYNTLFTQINQIKDTIITLSPLILGLVAGFTAFNVLTSIVAGITALSTALTVAGGVAGIFATGLAFITAPITLIALAIAGLVAGLVLLYQNWDTVSNFVITKSQEISTFTVGAFNQIVTFFTTTFSSQIAIITDVFTIIGNVIQGSLAVIQGLFSSVLLTIQAIFSGNFGAIQGIWQNFFNFVGQLIANFVLSTLLKFGDIINNFVQLGGKIKDGISNIPNIFTDVFNQAKDNVINKINDLINFIKNAFSNIKLPELKFPEIKLPEIPKFANGTDNFAGGLARFGEAGQELITLPNGVRGLTTGDTTSFLPRGTSILNGLDTARYLRTNSNVNNNDSRVFNQQQSRTVNNYSQSFNGFNKSIYNLGY
jgi:tape measure domain-containing protein